MVIERSGCGDLIVGSPISLAGVDQPAAEQKSEAVGQGVFAEGTAA
jgi:hypothetical protein